MVSKTLDQIIYKSKKPVVISIYKEFTVFCWDLL